MKPARAICSKDSLVEHVVRTTIVTGDIESLSNEADEGIVHRGVPVATLLNFWCSIFVHTAPGVFNCGC